MRRGDDHLSELTVPALIAARNLSQELEAELSDRPAPHIVLNRMSNRLLGPAPTLREAQRALKREALATLTSDWESAAKSVNLGGPIHCTTPAPLQDREETSPGDRSAGVGQRAGMRSPA